MAGDKGSAYGTPASDTSFRRNYDLDEYAEKAKVREGAEREEAKARYEAKMAGKKYYKPATGDETHTRARRQIIDLEANVGKTTLVPAGAGQGKRGRGAGFYCAACDLTFKDNIQWVEHVNSMQHLRAIGETGEVKKASAADVHERIAEVWERLQEQKRAATTTLKERLEVREEEEAREREARRAKRLEELAKKKAAKEDAEKVKVEYGEDVRVEGEHDEEDMMAAMGITGFGTSKK
ncbi:Uu.00g024110.m01.CDS01 [Anthostomella pinea]|uniref:Uu.00g024110.m01.CDS01 n=1 Tax=Anthostomella pinea TaxID=933095 RepID=A0AAI8W056_9PEZI|nr:Uu.00g024110.m01.CDS01 [Anthostomella pinea]